MSHRKKDPSYRLHKSSGQAIVTIPDGVGGRKDVLLGKYDSPESWTEYNRVLAQWKGNGRRLTPKAETANLSINELIERFWPEAEKHYRHPDGTPTSELDSYRLSLRTLKRLYGLTAVGDFGPLSLKAVRKAMIEGSWMTDDEKEKQIERGKPIGCCRNVINQRIGRIRRMFRWAVENELVPPSVFHGLQAVRGLQKGRSEARETEPVKPVPEAFVKATLPHMLPLVADMVQLQLLTGMRPGELVIMRAVDIDMSGNVWLYKPSAHKTQWRGHSRIIAIGPQGQEIIRRYLKPNVEAYLFCPREAMEAHWAQLRQKRKSKVQPSQHNRRKQKPQREYGERYDVGSYALAVKRACLKAGVPHWHPHQLRHTRGTKIRREFGIEMARAALGQKDLKATEIYAEFDESRVIEIASKLG